ncbi:MAG: hypothetical protein CMA11_04380 [Euryarchaeota archaeon]|nr:hypothetical protein [Euryarchaeota archaeon]
MFKRPWKVWQPHWREKGNSKLFWYTIISLILAMALPYSVINQIMGYFDRSVMDPIMPIDSMVPFIGWSFIIYLTLYLYYPAAAWFGRVNDERIREMFAFYQALFVMTWVVNLIFILFPTEVYIRDQIPADVRAGEGFWGFWFGDLMHNTDMPYNAWPSLHVVQSLMIVMLLRHWKIITGFKEVLVWVAWVALCISVMTTKQHFFFDLITGIVTGICCWYWMCIPAMKSSNNEEWNEAFPSTE